MDVSEVIRQWQTLLPALPSSEESAWGFLDRLATGWQREGGQFLAATGLMLQAYDKLLHILREINDVKEVKTVITLILDSAIELTAAERGFLLLRDIEIARHFDGADIMGEYKISRKLAESVQQSEQPIISGNAAGDDRLTHFASVHACRELSVLCVPVTVRGEKSAVLYLDNRLVRNAFQPHHLTLVTAFTSQLTLALQSASMYQELTQRSQKIHLLNIALQRKVQLQSRELELVRAQRKTTEPVHYHNIYGQSVKIRELICMLEKIKDHDMPVLIQGESGTGKELVARAIHAASSRRSGPFISENCAAIPETLLESELFGYEKGAFSGATQTKKGLFEEASSGTLFLDEVAELSVESQKKLLRALAEKEIRRVGGHEPIAVDVRIISASNRDLKEMVEAGELREDLFYRLNGILLTAPPLRERREDIPLLVEHFLSEAAALTGQEAKRIDKSLLSLLIGYAWPGNIRQLRNEILRLAALSGTVLEASYLSPEILPGAGNGRHDDKVRNLPHLLREVEKGEILRVLQLAHHNKSRAAQLLGISRFTLQRKLDKYGMG
jgi:transcriptional regulator with PAS, ATPase and Fis domain